MAAQFLQESGEGTIQVENRQCREKNDQAKAKQAEQWANLVSQVGPLLLGNTNTAVFFQFVFNMLGSIILFFLAFIYLLFLRFTWLIFPLLPRSSLLYFNASHFAIACVL